MKPTTLRILGFVFLLSAVVIAVLNLKRVAGLGLYSLPALLMIFGAVLMARARKAEREDRNGRAK